MMLHAKGADLAPDNEGALAFDGAWYEQQLARDERRRRGQYATPPELVARILHWVGYRAGADLEHLTLLDPACGSGNFLASAARVVITHGQASGWSARRMLTVLQTNLWGLETDPAACALAEMRLGALARNLRPGGVPRFHIHQMDALALAAAPRYGVVVGNPPYLASRHYDLQSYRQGFVSNGQRDAYLLFLEQACRFVVPGGWLGLVLPDAVLARGNAADVRRLLLESFTIRRLLHLEGVFRAEVGTLVLIAQRAAPSSHVVITWGRANWRDTSQSKAGAVGRFSFEVWRRQPRAELRYLLGAAEAALFERMRREVLSAPLGELVRISRGEELAQGAAQPAGADDESFLPVLRGGGDVRPFCCRFAGVYLRRDQVAKPLERYHAPKLLVVKSTGMLQAALDEQGYVAMQTLYLLHPQTGLPALGYLLALLNSRLLRGYLWLHHTAYKLVQPQLEQEALARLPIPLAPSDQHQQIATLASRLRAYYHERDSLTCEDEAARIQLDQTISDFYTCLDACIAALCGLTAAEQMLLKSLPIKG
jgi:hypothetical protein